MFYYFYFGPYCSCYLNIHFFIGKTKKNLKDYLKNIMHWIYIYYFAKGKMLKILRTKYRAATMSAVQIQKRAYQLLSKDRQSLHNELQFRILNLFKDNGSHTNNEWLRNLRQLFGFIL